MRAAIFGGEGMLGRDLAEVFGSEAVPLTHADADIRDPGAVADVIERSDPEAVILAAAFHDVPRCETEPDNAFAVNALGALHVARACAAAGLKLVFVSTDYVFAGNLGRPCTEEDLTGPLNLYGVSKRAGELAVLQAHPQAQVVRTCGLYGLNPCRAKKGHTIVEMILGRLAKGEPLRMVNDEFAAPTWTLDLARQIKVILERGGPGIYHAVNPPGGSWYDFACTVRGLSGFSTPIEPVPAATFPSAVKKPPYAVLKNARLEREGLLIMPPMPEALAGYLKRRGPK